MAKEKTSHANNKKINLNITTPRGLKFVEKADMVIMRCIDGDFGVLYGHQPVSTVLGDGILRIFYEGTEKRFALFGGIAEISEKEVNIYTTLAQHPEEIDLERARADREEAEAAMDEVSGELQLQSARVALRRSLVRIEVSLHMEEADYYGDDEDVT